MEIPRPRFDAHGDPVVVDWFCPVCSAYTPRVRRPGRPAVYCSNACRQKAYRYRCRHGVRLLRGDGQATERGRGARVVHLLRPESDPLASTRRPDRALVSLCGAFVRPARDHAHLLPDFPFDAVDACFSCVDLTGSDRADPPMVYPWDAFLAGRSDLAQPPVPAPLGRSAEVRGAPRYRRRRRWHHLLGGP